MNEKNAIIVEDLTVAYSLKPVLWDIDVTMRKGKLTAILGPNGAGKSTLIKAILGLIKPVSGSVRFNFDHTGSDWHKEVAYVPQSGSVDWDFPATVKDVVLMGRYSHIGWFKRPSKHDIDLAMHTLDLVGMADFSSRQISQLSGGQQQRVFLARSLVQEAEIYIMDEPLKGVDKQTEKIVIDLLKSMRDQGKSVIVVHHDLATVKDYFDDVVMINVEHVASGTVSSVFTEKNIDLTFQRHSYDLLSGEANE